MNQLLASLFTRKPSLLFCIVMDLIGMATYVMPALGEWGDLIWAPLSAMIFFRQFGGAGGLLGGAFSFLEEILPFTDLIPTFTIAWFLQKQFSELTQTARPKATEVEDAEVIDIS